MARWPPPAACNAAAWPLRSRRPEDIPGALSDRPREESRAAQIALGVGTGGLGRGGRPRWGPLRRQVQVTAGRAVVATVVGRHDACAHVRHIWRFAVNKLFTVRMYPMYGVKWVRHFHPLACLWSVWSHLHQHVKLNITAKQFSQLPTRQIIY